MVTKILANGTVDEEMRRYVSLFTNILIVEWRESMREIIQG
jgi:hypothetical protein